MARLGDILDLTEADAALADRPVLGVASDSLGFESVCVDPKPMLKGKGLL